MGASDLTTTGCEQPDPLPAEALSALGSPERPYYAVGVLLDDTDFIAEQLYHRARQARAFAAMYGHGTLAGLRVAGVFHPVSTPGVDPRLEIEVAPGAALDRFGRLIELRRRQCLDLGRWWGQMQALPADDPARQRLVSAVRGGPADARLHVDVWLRFVACPRGRTPSFAAGPYNATDASVPSRLADAFELSFGLSRLDGDAPAQPAPRSRTLQRLAEALATLTDPAEREAARRDQALAEALAAWPQPSAANAAALPRLVEHDATTPDTEAADTARVLLGRVHVPVQQADATAFPQLDRARWQALDAALAAALAAEQSAADSAALVGAWRARQAAVATHPIDNAVRPLVANPFAWRGRLAADVPPAP